MSGFSFLVRILFSTFGSLVLSCGAKAQVGPDWTLKSTVGLGCPAGSAQIRQPSGTQTIISFQKMAVSKGPGISLAESRKSCSFSFELLPTAGYNYTFRLARAKGKSSIGSNDVRGIITQNLTVQAMQFPPKNIRHSVAVIERIGGGNVEFDTPVNIAFLESAHFLNCQGQRVLLHIDNSVRLAGNSNRISVLDLKELTIQIEAVKSGCKPSQLPPTSPGPRSPLPRF